MDQRSRGIPREYPGSPGETKDPNRSPNSETDPGTDLNHQGAHHVFLDIGPAIRILQLNIEGISTATVTPISPEEVDAARKYMKCGKAPGYDNIHPEFLKNLGPRAKKWLAVFLTRIISEKNLPKSWRVTKTVVIPKPGKDPKMASSYRPISLLSMCNKLLERIILHRISPAVDVILNIEHGFRPGRSTQDQFLAITTYVENGYHQRDKTGVVFLDLTAAYDTVWHKDLLVKLSKVLPCLAVSVIELLLEQRRFPHGLHQQLMEGAEEWPATRICSCTDSLQLVHQ